MSLTIDDDEFNLGLSLCHDRLVGAVQAYRDFLVIFGTAPDVSLAEKLERLAHKVLQHDGAEARPLRYEVSK